MRKFAWKRDPEDKRDWKFKALLKTVALPEIPDKVDLSPNLSPVEDQETIGSCTANAAVGAMEYLEWQKTQKRWACFKKFRDLSRLFVYYNTRLIEGTVDFDSGATIRNTVKSLGKYGVCDARLWPYEISKWDDRPTDTAYEKGVNRKAKDYYRAYDLNDIQQALALGFPVSFGAMIFEPFMTGVTRLPKPGDRSMGGHAMLIVGYDRKDKKCLVRNSWGVNWGSGGYCRFPFEYISDPGLCGDFWVIRS